MKREAHDRPFEPPVLEGQRLCPAELETGSGRVHTRAGEHLLGGVHGPDLAASIDERAGESSRPAADLENPAPEEVTTLDEELEELPPLRVDRPQAVVALGESAEVGLGPAAQRPPMSSSGSVIASMAC